MSIAKFNKWQSVDGVTRNAVLQVVQAVTDTQVSATGQAQFDSGLSASITPTSATSKILVLVNQGLYTVTATSNVTWGGIWIYRDSTAIHTPRLNTTNLAIDFGVTMNAVAQTSNAGFMQQYSNHVLDSPGTTNEITYKTTGAGYYTDTTVYFQFSGSQGPMTSRMLLMEIAQ